MSRSQACHRILCGIVLCVLLVGGHSSLDRAPSSVKTLETAICPPRIAIIGSGITGSAVAYFLREYYDTDVLRQRVQEIASAGRERQVIYDDIDHGRRNQSTIEGGGALYDDVTEFPSGVTIDTYERASVVGGRLSHVYSTFTTYSSSNKHRHPPFVSPVDCKALLKPGIHEPIPLPPRKPTDSPTTGNKSKRIPRGFVDRCPPSSAVYSDAIEMGGSLIHSSNRYMSHWIKELGLEQTPRDHGAFIIRNDTEYNSTILFESPRMSALLPFHLAYRYGALNMLNLRAVVKDHVHRLDMAYEILGHPGTPVHNNSDVPFTTPQDLLRSVDLYEATQASLAELLCEKVAGLKKSSITHSGSNSDSTYISPHSVQPTSSLECAPIHLLLNELVAACTQANYNQRPTDISGLAGMVALAPLATGSVYGVRGGAVQIPERLLRAAGASLRVNARVIHLEDINVDKDEGEASSKKDDPCTRRGKKRIRLHYELKKTSREDHVGTYGSQEESEGISEWEEGLTQVVKEDYDYVVVATPLGNSGQLQVASKYDKHNNPPYPFPHKAHQPPMNSSWAKLAKKVEVGNLGRHPYRGSSFDVDRKQGKGVCTDSEGKDEHTCLTVDDKSYDTGKMRKNERDAKSFKVTFSTAFQGRPNVKWFKKGGSMEKKWGKRLKVASVGLNGGGNSNDNVDGNVDVLAAEMPGAMLTAVRFPNDVEEKSFDGFSSLNAVRRMPTRPDSNSRKRRNEDEDGGKDDGAKGERGKEGRRTRRSGRGQEAHGKGAMIEREEVNDDDVDGKAAVDDVWRVKTHASVAISKERIKRMFPRGTQGVRMTAWAAYPKFSVPETFTPFVFPRKDAKKGDSDANNNNSNNYNEYSTNNKNKHKGSVRDEESDPTPLFYVNALEPAASTMETQAIAARNVATLLVVADKKWKEKEGVRGKGTKEDNKNTTSQSDKRDEL